MVDDMCVGGVIGDDVDGGVCLDSYLVMWWCYVDASLVLLMNCR